MTAGEHRNHGLETPAPLGFVLAAAARKVAKFYAAALGERPPHSPAQLVVLRRLWLEDGQTLRDLAPRAGLDPTSLNWLVDQLEKQGFVERRRDGVDRRLVRAWLTDEGRALEGDLSPEIERWEAALATELLRHHAAEELAAFRSVLATVAEALPEGQDLWAARVAVWDERLATLKLALEGEEPGERS